MPDPVLEPKPVVVPEPAVEPVPVVYGKLFVNSQPKGQAITIDGKGYGVTPKEIRLPVGLHSVTVEGFAKKDANVRKQQLTNLLFR